MKDLENICLEIDHSWSKDYQAVAPEIVQTSSFQFKNFDHYIRVNAAGEHAYTYTRGSNPTIEILENKIAQLEGGECGKAFASGMGAISATILSLLSRGDHIIVVNTVYSTSVKMIQQFKRFGIESTKVDVYNTPEVFKHIKQNTKMIYFESPSSQKFELLDLELISEVAREKGIYTLIDNTWATPLFQKPLKHGIDIVVHSCSKYISGHSDVVGGVVVTTSKIMHSIDDFGAQFLGATMSPMNAWLAVRGLRTMPVRLQAQEESLRKVLTYIKSDMRIEAIHHPLCGGKYQTMLAEKYLTGYSSVLGIVLRDATSTKLQIFIDSLKYFTLAYSWGGFESLVMPVYKGNNERELHMRGLKVGHIRLYIGLEESELLIEDIKQALDRAYGKLDRVR